jgi:hypothetical protein
MAVVKTVKSGNCTIRFHDDYFVKTKEEEQAILDRVAEIYINAFSKQAMKKLEEERNIAQ